MAFPFAHPDPRIQRFAEICITSHRARDLEQHNEEEHDKQALRYLRLVKNISTPRDFPNSRQGRDYQFPLLVAAAKQGFLRCVSFLLAQKDIDIEACDTKGNNALLWAASYNYPAVVKTLVTHASHHLPLNRFDLFLNKTGQNGFSPITVIAKNGNSKLLKYFFNLLSEYHKDSSEDFIAAITVHTDNGFNILHGLCRNNDLQTVDHIFRELRWRSLQHHDKVNNWLNLETRGGTPLSIAIKSDLPEPLLVQSLLRAGAYPVAYKKRNPVEIALRRAEKSECLNKKQLYADIFLQLVAHPAIDLNDLPQPVLVDGQPLWQKDLPDIAAQFLEIIERRKELSGDYEKVYWNGVLPDFLWRFEWGEKYREKESEDDLLSCSEACIYGNVAQLQLALKQMKTRQSKKDFIDNLNDKHPSILSEAILSSRPEPFIVRILLDEGVIPHEQDLFLSMRSAEKELIFQTKLLRCAIVLEIMGHPAVNSFPVLSEFDISWCEEVPDIQNAIEQSLLNRKKEKTSSPSGRGIII